MAQIEGQAVLRPGSPVGLLGLGLAGWVGYALGWGLVRATGAPAALHAALVIGWYIGIAGIWFRRYGRYGPVTTAALFTGLLAMLDWLMFGGLLLSSGPAPASTAVALLPVGLAFLTALATGAAVSVAQTIEVRGVVPAPIEDVFEAFVHPDLIRAHPGVHHLEIIETGAPVPWGPGCLRDVELDRGRFRERITAWVPPNEIRYRIEASSAPIEHLDGQVQLTQDDGVTFVTWRSEFRVRSFPISGAVGRWAAGEMAKDLRRHLEVLAAMLATRTRTGEPSAVGQ